MSADVCPVARARLPVAGGVTMDLLVYRHVAPDGAEDLALVLESGDRRAGVPDVRIHSGCLTGEVFGSRRCDCGPQLHAAIERLGRAPRGILVYLPGDEGRGIGLVNKVRAYALQDEGVDTVRANHLLGFGADLRDYRVAIAVLRALEVSTVRLLTNNPDKVRALEAAGIRVEERVPHEFGLSDENRAYLDVKKRVLGHVLTGV